jgi:hypothetical protein
METEILVTHSEGGMGCKPRKAGSSRNWKGKEVDSPPRALRRDTFLLTP